MARYIPPTDYKPPEPEDDWGQEEEEWGAAAGHDAATEISRASPKGPAAVYSGRQAGGFSADELAAYADDGAWVALLGRRRSLGAWLVGARMQVDACQLPARGPSASAPPPPLLVHAPTAPELNRRLGRGRCARARLPSAASWRLQRLPSTTGWRIQRQRR